MSGPAPSIQYAWDGPGTLGAPSDGLYPRWNNATGAFEMASAGVSDHGGMTGLGDDDHPGAAWLAGRAGGQTLNLGLNSGDAGTINASAHATKGALTLGASQVVLPDGTQAAPGLAMASDTNLGLYATAGQMRMVDGSSVYADWGNVTGVFRMLRGVTITSGTVGSPGLGFSSDADNGVYYIGTNNWALSAGGGSVLALNAATPNVLVTAQGAAHVPLTIKLAASQTANALEVRTSADALLARVSASGQATFADALTLTNSGNAIFYNGLNATMKLNAGGTWTFMDGASQTLMTLVHNSGGTLRNAGTTMIDWTSAGIVSMAAEVRATSLRQSTTQTTLTGDQFNWSLNPEGVAVLALHNNTGAGTRTGLASGAWRFTAHTAATVPFTIKLAAAQTANALEVQNSAGTVLSFFDSIGRATFGAASRLGGTEPLYAVGARFIPTSAGAVIMSDTGFTWSAIQTVDASAASWSTNGASKEFRLGGGGLPGEGGILAAADSAIRMAYASSAPRLGFFAVTPVVRPTPADHVAAIAALDTLGLTAGSPALSSTQLLLPAGAAGTPALTFAGDTDNGLYYIGANNWGLARGGAAMIELGSGGNVIKFWSATNHVDQIRAADGTAAGPGITWNNDTNTGIYRISADVGGLSAGSGVCLRWSAGTRAVQAEASASTQIPFVAKSGPSASVDAIQTMNNSETVQFALGPAGQIKTNQSAANTNTPSGATARQLPIYDVAGVLLGYIPVYASAW